MNKKYRGLAFVLLLGSGGQLLYAPPPKPMVKLSAHVQTTKDIWESGHKLGAVRYLVTGSVPKDIQTSVTVNRNRDNDAFAGRRLDAGEELLEGRSNTEVLQESSFVPRDLPQRDAKDTLPDTGVVGRPASGTVPLGVREVVFTAPPAARPPAPAGVAPQQLPRARPVLEKPSLYTRKPPKAKTETQLEKAEEIEATIANFKKHNPDWQRSSEKRAELARYDALRSQGAEKHLKEVKEKLQSDVVVLEKKGTPKEMREQALQQKQAAIANDILALREEIGRIEKALKDPAITPGERVKLENAMALATHDIGLKQQENYRPALDHYLGEFKLLTDQKVTARNFFSMRSQRKEMGRKFLAALQKARESNLFKDEMFTAFTNEKSSPEAVAIFKEHANEPIVKEVLALTEIASLKQEINTIKIMRKRGQSSEKEYKDALREYVQFVAKVRKQKAMPQATLDQEAPEYQEALTVLGLQPKPSKSARVVPVDAGP